MSISNRIKVAIIGFGEEGGIFAADLAKAGADVAAFDTGADVQQRSALAGMAAHSPADACRGAAIVFVCVTAGSVLDAMRSLKARWTKLPSWWTSTASSPARNRRPPG